MFRFALSLLLLFSFFALNAQRFGGSRPSKQWNKVENENYRIIYSPELEKTAKKVAYIFSRMNAKSVNIGQKRRNLNIILQNSTTQANGYVSYAPFVSEFFLTPHPNGNAIGTLPFYYTLGIHEYQHILQAVNSYYGVSKIAYWIAGEAGWGSVTSLAIPNWFFEGNAVLAETQYSEQGRGRIPSFFNGYRSFVLEDKIPSYDKARNGSIQDFVPSHYPLGYLMVKYGREKYGEDYWTNVLRRSASYRDILYPFSRALKKEGGEHSKKMYNSMMNEFSSNWKTNEMGFGTALFLPKKHEVSNYSFPTFNENGTLYFINGTYDKVSYFCSLVDNKVTKIRMAGIRSNNYFDVKGGKILSTQTYVDKRWAWEDFEDIVIYDIESKNLKRLTKEEKYFHPAFSTDGKTILSLYVAPNGQNELRLLDTESGVIIQKYSNPENYYFSYINSTSDGNFIASARNNKGQMALVNINSKGEVKNLTDWNYHIIGRVEENEGTYYFTSSYYGVDNLYALKDETLFELTNGGPGRYSPTVNPKTNELHFTEFSTHGYALKKAELPSLTNDLHSITPLRQMSFYNSDFMKQSEVISTTGSLDSLTPSTYKNTKSLINIHSWAPEINQTELGFSLESDNVLNSFDLSGSYSYNLNEERGGFKLDAEYAQFYVHINASIENRNRLIASHFSDVEFNETTGSFGLSLPLDYSSNRFAREFNISSDYKFLNTNSTEILNNSYHLIINNLRYKQSKLKAKKNIFTQLGISSEISDQRALNNDNYRFLIQNGIALRGIFKNDNVLIDLDARFKDDQTIYRPVDQFVYARGFERLFSNELYKFSGNYHFPICYPDKGALGIIYLLRIRGNIFYDYSYSADDKKDFSSVGTELIMDTRWLRILPISLGLRYTQLLSQKSMSKQEGKTEFLELFIPVARF